MLGELWNTQGSFKVIPNVDTRLHRLSVCTKGRYVELTMFCDKNMKYLCIFVIIKYYTGIGILG